MKSSWKKLKDFAQKRPKDKIVSSYVESTESLDEFAKRMQKVQDMRKFYEGFYTMSSKVAVRAHGFSEAIQDMGNYLTKCCSSFGGINAGNFLVMVGKSQLEVARFFDLYAAHVSSTLTISIENMLHEMQVAEETKLKYDERRRFFDHLRLRHTKESHKNQKSELQSEKQLLTAKHQFDELALSLDFHLLSLERRRFHKVITKISQHHTAQMHAFRRAFSAVNKIEPYIDLMAKKRKIDRQSHIDERNTDSGSDSDLTGNLPVTPDEQDDSINSSSSEKIPVQENIIDDEPSAARRSSYAGSKSVPVSPVRLPEDKVVDTFHNLVTENSLHSRRALQRRSSEVSSVVKEKQKAPHSNSVLGTSTSHLAPKDLIVGQLHKPYTPNIDHPEDISMFQDLVAEKSLIGIPTNAQVRNSAKRGDTSLQSFPAQLSASLSTLTPLLPQEQFPSLRISNLGSSQLFQKHAFGPAPMLNKRHSHSGPLTPHGNLWPPVRIGTPSSHVLPPIPTRKSHKSQPLWYDGVRPLSSPSLSPFLSHPTVRELHKLPSPPSNSIISNKPTITSEGSSASSSISAAPLPQAPAEDEGQKI